MKEIKYFRPYAIEVGIAFLAGVVVGRYIAGYKSGNQMDKEEVKEFINDAIAPIKKQSKKLPGFRFEDGKLVVEVKR